MQGDGASRPEGEAMYPRARLDALTDGVFSVAMTLLVLDLRLPEDFAPHDARELLMAILDLTPKFVPYILSFGVLGLRWLAGIQVRSPDESLGSEYVLWWLLYLLFITCFPFVTMVVGRFPDQAPAIWLYAGNTLVVSLVGARLLALVPDVEQVDRRRHQLGLAMLVGSSLIVICWSLVDPARALWPFVLNFFALVYVCWRQEAQLKRAAKP
jgi:uncharacterized membrane protein